MSIPRQARTKIVATVGPACSAPAQVEALIGSGVDVFRLNFSHGSAAEHGETLGHIRRIAEELDRPVAVMQDLAGPKVRIGDLADPVEWEPGRVVRIARHHADPPDVTTTYGRIVDDVEVGHRILVADGTIELRVQAKEADALVCGVVAGGTVSRRKGINLPDTALSMPALTGKDLADLRWGAEQKVDFVALSFVRRAEDLDGLRNRLKQAGSAAGIVAKVERPEAVDRIDAVIEASDAVMVARGDLGVEMSPVRVPLIQKDIIRRCVAACVPVITATQMLESMVERPVPTRAEVSDVANAVLDGTDAVMLSAETAIGRYPVRAVKMMDEIALATETYATRTAPAPRPTEAGPGRMAALADAVHAIVRWEQIDAAVVFTSEGSIARTLAQQRLPIPILAMSSSPSAVRRMSLLYGVHSVVEPAPEHTRDVLARGAEHLKRMGVTRPGGKVVVLTGRPIGQAGTTSNLAVHTIE